MEKSSQQNGTCGCAIIYISRTAQIDHQSVTSFVITAAKIMFEQNNGYVDGWYIHTL